MITRMLLGTVLLAGLLAAAPIFSVLPAGNLTAVIVNSNTTAPPTFVAIDFRGNSNIAVYDPGFIGAANATDMLAAFPNGVITIQTFDTLQSVALNFTALSVVGSELLVSEFGTPNGVVTDPAVSAFLGATLFDFTHVLDAQDGNISASYFLLTSVSASDVAQTPEPASVLLCFAGLGVGCVLRKFRRSLTPVAILPSLE